MRKFFYYLLGSALTCVLLCSHVQTKAQKPDTTYLSTVYVCANNLPYFYGGEYFKNPGFYWVHFEGSKGQDSVCFLPLSVYNVNQTKLWAGLCDNVLRTTGYTYNGKTYYASGIYLDTLTSHWGCDSVVHLTINSYKTYEQNMDINLCQGEVAIIGGTPYGAAVGTFNKTVNLKTVGCNCDSVIHYTIKVSPSYNRQENITVCESEIPYFWHNMYLYSTNDYEQKFTTVNGCDSVFSVRFVVNPSYASTDSKVVCSSDLQAGYTYGSTVINSVGIYNVPFTASNGCDSVVTLKVSEGREYFVEKAISICPSQLPFTFNRRTYLGSVVDTIPLVSQAGCDSNVVLRLTVNSAYTRNVTDVVCENDLPYRYGTETFTASGNYKIQMTTVNGCDSVVNLSLTVNPAFDTVVNVTVCDDALPYTFDANNVFTLPGDYTIQYQTASLCDSIIKVHFVVNPTYKVMDEQTVCHQDFPYTYGDSTFTQGGYYTVVFTSATTCDSTVLLRIVEHFPPDSIKIMYGDEKIGKAGDYTYSVDLVSTDFPNTYYEWTCNNPNWTIVRHNREGNVIHIDIPRSAAFGEADITVKAINDCGETEYVSKHIRSMAGADILVYPNPVYANEYFTVTFCDMIGEHIIRVTNEVGNVLHQEKVDITYNYQEFQISTEDYASGNYFIRVETPEKTIIKKIVILTTPK